MGVMEQVSGCSPEELRRQKTREFRALLTRLDKIPEFEGVPLSQLVEIARDPGYIPRLGLVFAPMNEYETPDYESVHTEAEIRGFSKWNSGKLADNGSHWKEHSHMEAYYLDEDARKIVDEWDSRRQLKENLDKLRSGSINSNLVRLLTHINAPACRDFALACMRYVPEMDNMAIGRCFPHIGGDGDAGAQFWTYGPYIMEALKWRRLLEGREENEKEDFYRVLLWSRARTKTGDWGYDAIYPGVETLRDVIHKLYLPRDGFHPIHKYIAAVGEHVAKYLYDLPVDDEVIVNKTAVRSIKKRDSLRESPENIDEMPLT